MANHARCFLPFSSEVIGLRRCIAQGRRRRVSVLALAVALLAGATFADDNGDLVLARFMANPNGFAKGEFAPGVVIVKCVFPDSGDGPPRGDLISYVESVEVGGSGETAVVAGMSCSDAAALLAYEDYRLDSSSNLLRGDSAHGEADIDATVEVARAAFAATPHSA